MDNLFLIFFVSRVISVCGLWFANLTQNGCINFNTNLNLEGETILVRKDEKMVFSKLPNSEQILTAGNFTNRIIDFKEDRARGNFSFCIQKTRIEDHGNYIFQIKWKEKLYILDQPKQPELSIVNNGTVGYEKGQISCKSFSTSMPNDLPLNYHWTVNGTKIVSNEKYSFGTLRNSTLLIDVERNDRLNYFECYATEEHGMTSVESEIIKIDPKQSPVVTIQPDASEYRIILHDTASIRCVVTEAYPSNVSFSWYNDNTLIDGKQKNNYNISNVSMADAGVYNCTASNGYGNDGSANIRLIVLYGPIVQPLSISQIEDRQLLVECPVRSNPEVQDSDVTWTKNGNSTFIWTGLKLSIERVSISDIGSFICIVRITLNPTLGPPVSRNASADVQIDVLYGPVIKLLSMTSEEEGRPLIVQCHIQSNPIAVNENVTWSKSGNTTFIQTGINLTIPFLKINDHGVYTCTVRITLQPTVGASVLRNASESTQINVLFGPNIKQMSTISQIEDRMLSLNCSVQSNPTATDDNVTWTKKGNSTFSQTGLQLRISSVKKTDHGLFICTVSITFQPTERPSFIRNASASVKINVLYGPIIKPLATISQEEGRNVSVNCDVESNPIATDGNAVWRKKGNFTFNQTGLLLVLQSINRTDHGAFICTVRITLRPSVGSSIMVNASESVQINVTYPPDVSVSTFEEEMYEGNSTKFTCDVSSFPLPNITWKYLPENISIPETSRMDESFNKVSSVLEVRHLRCNNTGSYLCVAYNGIKYPRYALQNLNVLCKPRIASNGNEENYTFGRNDSLDLTVWFLAYPEPIYTWNFNGSNISSHSDAVNVTNVVDIYPFKFGTRIKKHELNEADIGMYHITASNWIGKTTTTLTIDFNREPDMAVINTCSTTEKAAMIYWKGGWNGGTSQRFIVRYKKHTDSTFTTTGSYIFEEIGKTDYSFLISSLQPGEVYIFQVQASNDIGNAVASTINCTVRVTKETEGLVAIIGGTSGAVASGVVVVVLIILIRQRRGNTRKKIDRDNGTNARTIESEEEDGLKDNILYESSGTDFSLQPNADVYAKVLKSEQKETALYTGVNKTSLPSKQGSNLTVGKKEKGHGKQKRLNQQAVRDDFYENVSSDFTLHAEQPKKTNKDGLVYADLVFNENGKNRKFTIHGIENRTEYADINLNLKADPLPSEESDKEDDVTANIRGNNGDE